MKVKELKPKIKEIREIRHEEDISVERFGSGERLSGEDFSHSFGEGEMSSAEDLGIGFKAKTMGGAISGGSRRTEEFSVARQEAKGEQEGMRYASEAERRTLAAGGIVGGPIRRLGGGSALVSQDDRAARQHEVAVNETKYESIEDLKPEKKRDRAWEG